MYWGWNGVGAASAKSIEASSYALLAQLKLDDLKASSEIAEFLQQHRTSGGAFSTTQVTVNGPQNDLSSWFLKIKP